MNKKIFNIIFLSLLLTVVVGCTTTTRTVSTGITVQSSSDIETAKSAFNQKNYPLAAKLLKPLAKEGDAYAQYALGYMYYNGLGVDQNQGLATHWLKLSASNGNKNAIQALRLIATTSSEPLGEKRADKNQDSASLSNEASVTVPESVVDSSMMAGYEEETGKESSDMAVMMNAEKATDKDTQPMSSDEEGRVSSSVEVADRSDTLTEGEKWIVSQPDGNYTIQLMVLGNESRLKQFIVDNNIQDSAVYYRFPDQGKDLFVLIQGSFESRSEAKNKIFSLPPHLHDAGPWVRSIGDIKKKLLSR